MEQANVFAPAFLVPLADPGGQVDETDPLRDLVYEAKHHAVKQIELGEVAAYRVDGVPAGSPGFDLLAKRHRLAQALIHAQPAALVHGRIVIPARGPGPVGAVAVCPQNWIICAPSPARPQPMGWRLPMF